MRRALTIPAVFVGAAVVWLSAPVWIPLALVVDLASGRRTSLLRALVFLAALLACEVAGVLGSAVLWLLGGARTPAGQARHYTLQRAWAHAILHSAMRIFGFRIETSGEEAVAAGPMLLLLRHASIADTMLPAEYVVRPHPIRLRYVLKQELLFEPCLDIVGNRLPNYFVDRQASDTEREVRGIQTLMHDLAPDEGVLIYPEGTRFTPAKRERVLQSLRAAGSDAQVERAARLHHVLPPRLRGTLALLEANPGLDAVFCAHTGFEGVSKLSHLWNRSLVGARARVHFWRVPYAAIPIERGERIDWLFDQWERVDAWIDANRTA